MKNLKLLTGTAVLAGLLLTTGCVKNEEADGVKALRQAQAGLLNAEATATTLKAEAEAAFRNAEAAVKQAEVAVKEAEARAKEITNAYNEASNAIALADAQIASDLLQAQTQASIDLLLVTAEKNLAQAQKDLEIALSDYEAELAADGAKNKNLAKYVDGYKDAISEVNTLRQEVIGIQRRLATAQLYFLNNDLTDAGTLAAAKELEKEILEIQLGYFQGWVERYEAVMGDLSTIANELVDVKEDIASLQAQIDDKEVEQELADQAREVALEEYQAAYDAWKEVVDKDELIETFSDEEVVESEIIPYSYLSDVVDPESIWDDGLGDTDGSYEDPDFDTEGVTYYSYYYYNMNIETRDLSIENWESTIATYEEYIDLLEEIQEQYSTELATLWATVEEEEAKIEPLQHAVNVAEVANQAEGTTESAQALADAEAALEAVDDGAGNGTYPDAVNAYWDFVNDVNASDIDNVFALYGNDPEASMTLIDGVPALIADYQASLETYESSLASLEEEKAEFEADLEIVEGYVAYLEGLQSGDLPALETAYQEAKAAFYAARAAYDQVAAELSALEAELDRAEDYEEVLEGNGEDIYEDLYEETNGLKEQIAQTEADIAEIDNDFANWETLIAALEAELEQKQTELAAWVAEADHYKELIDAELGEE